MRYRIRYSPAARDDVNGVWDDVWEASKDPDTADRYVRGILDQVAAYGDFPKAGIPLYYQGLFTGFYSVNYRAYKVFYRIREDNLDVLRVIMAKRDYIKILFEEENQ